MKRRTNLFYTSGDDSNFLTFSNYAEHITGVALATNFKLYPSRFICMNIEGFDKKYELDLENNYIESDSIDAITGKQIFIKHYLAGYYENKLAVLREAIIDENSVEIIVNPEHPDNKLRYLGYLIDAIQKYSKDFNVKAEIVYDSTITEFDYNGTFTDIICTIESGEIFTKEFKLSKSEIYAESYYPITDKANELYLFGWAHTINSDVEYIGPKEYENCSPIFDTTYKDNENNEFNSFIINNEYALEISEVEDNRLSEISFNVIIPLYDVVNFDIETNITEILQDETNEIDLNEVADKDGHVKNVPYGIWFANETITLKRDRNTKYAPAWSLLIGAQFKPFPTSNYLTQDSGIYSNMGGYATFAQILARQNTLYELMTNNENKVSEGLERIESVVSDLESIADLRSILDSLREDLTDLTDQVNKIKESLSSSNTDFHTWKNVNYISTNSSVYNK